MRKLVVAMTLCFVGCDERGGVIDLPATRQKFAKTLDKLAANSIEIVSAEQQQVTLLTQIRDSLTPEPQPAAVAVDDASQPNQSSTPAPVVDPLNDTPSPTEDGPPPPKETQNAKRPWTTAHYRLIDFSADWCEPCRRWAKNERDKISCEVEVHDIGTSPVSDVSTVPTLQLERWNGSDWQRVKRWIGYTPASVINGAVQDDIAAKNGTTKTEATSQRSRVGGATSSGGAIVVRPKSRRQQRQLRQWIERNYSPLTATRHADVYPRSNVWNHLRGDHGYSSEQVVGLPQWMALALHDASHIGRMSPWE